MGEFDFTRWGVGHITRTQAIPYLDIDGEDTPVDFLFRYRGTHNFIARGNTQLVKGREKTGKSAIGIALIVAAMKGTFLDIEPNRSDYSILWVDTEQDKATLRERAKAALKMAHEASSGNRLFIVSLKGENPSERLNLTLTAIQETKPDIVFIDGVVDLCEDFNDNKESTSVTNELLKATEENNCAILCVIHTNKKDDEARGHLGTILQQKCSEVYEVSKSGDTATVKQDKCRFADIPSISFKFADGFILEEAQPGTTKADSRKQELQAKFGNLFAETTEYKYKELCESYSEQEAVGKSSAQKAVKEAVDFGVLVKQGKDRDTRYTYMFPNVFSHHEDGEPDSIKSECIFGGAQSV